MKILVVGSGAVGGYFGGRLLQAGRDVTFFVRPQRAAILAEQGLRIQSPHGNVHLASPPTITSEYLHRSKFDLALLSCKAQDLSGIVDAFAPAIGNETAVLPLLNGMRHLDILDERFGSGRVLGGVCMVSATRGADGTIVQFTPLQQILFGERGRGNNSLRSNQILASLSDAGFGVQLSENVVQAMWDKWVFIATLAGITCLMRASIADIEAAGAGQVTRTLLDEVSAISKAEGFPVRSEAFEQYRSMLTNPETPLQASMLRDIENGAATEADHVVGDMLVRAGRHGLQPQTLRMANYHLNSYEARRARLLREKARS